MKKKITMLLASLLACVGVMKAAVTDLPQMTTSTDDIKWYIISNTRSTSGKYLYWTESGVKDSNDRTGASFFYLTGSADACYIHNYSTDLLFSGAEAWTEAGKACKLSVSPLGTGLMIGFDGTYLNEQNSANGFTTWGDVNDDGSVFVFEEVTDFAAIIDVPAAKAAAIAELNKLATVSVIYSAAVTSAVNEINAVTPASNGLKDLNDAVEAVNAIVVNYRNAAYQALGGRYFVFKPAERTTYIAMGADHADGDGTTNLNRPAQLWQFVYDNGAVNLYNPYTDKYLGAPAGTSAAIPVVDDQANAGDYALNVFVENYIALQVGGATAHVDGYYDLVRWDDTSAGASKFSFEEVKDFSSIISAYKESTITTLGSWEKLTVVFDAELVAAAKTAVNAINTTDWATFAAIDAELKKVTDPVANNKVFTFQTIATDNHRAGVWVAANDDATYAIGAHTENAEFNAIWSLKHATGASFFMQNVLTGKYFGDLGNSTTNTSLTENPDFAYSFEIINAAENLVEVKCGGKTMHASNHNDDKLLNYDGNENASRWTITSVDIVSDVHDVLISLNALQSAYDAKAYAADAEVGEGLGQYQGDKGAIVTALNAGKVILDMSLAEQVALDVDAINAAAEALKNASDLTLNMPVQGKFYRIKSAVSDKYVTAPATTGTAMTMADEASANSILYWDAEGHLLVYGTGYYINGKNHAHLGYKATYTVEGSKTGVVGAYTIKPSGNNHWYATDSNVDFYQNAAHANCNFVIEEVTTLPVTVTAAGYATLYAPVALEIPASVEAYTGTLNGKWLTLNEVTGVIPANTGVVLKAEANTYDFAVTTGGSVESNGLAGTIATTDCEASANYTLANGEDGVGFYLYQGTRLAGFRAYLPKGTDNNATALRIRFAGEETGIEQIGGDAELVIYDLAGRRVEKMEKGIYIVNGKKVVIK